MTTPNIVATDDYQLIVNGRHVRLFSGQVLDGARDAELIEALLAAGAPVKARDPEVPCPACGTGTLLRDREYEWCASCAYRTGPAVVVTRACSVNYGSNVMPLTEGQVIADNPNLAAFLLTTAADVVRSLDSEVTP